MLTEPVSPFVYFWRIQMRNIYLIAAVAFAVLSCGFSKPAVSATTKPDKAKKTTKSGKVVCPTSPASCTIGKIEVRNTKGENKVFFEAVMKDNVSVVSSMLKKSKRFLNIRNMMNATPLHVAAKTGKPKSLAALIKAGADVNAVNEQGRTPLHAAATHNHMDIIKFLIAHGAKVSPRSKNLGTPLHDAAVNGNLEVAKYLLARGADINATSKRGVTPLTAALTRNRKEVAKLLIDRGAKFDAAKLAALMSNKPDAMKNMPNEQFCCENL